MQFQKKLFSQLQDNPYRANLIKSRRNRAGMSNDPGRRIVTDTNTNNSSFNTNIQTSATNAKQPPRKGTLNPQSFQNITPEDLQLLLGIQTMKSGNAISNINNYNNIHININDKGFPAVKKRVVTQEDTASKTPQSMKAKNQSSSLHEASSHLQVNEHRSVSTYANQKKKLKTAESFESDILDQQYQNMIISQIRLAIYEFNTFLREQKDIYRERLNSILKKPSSTKNANNNVVSLKKGNFLESQSVSQNKTPSHSNHYTATSTQKERHPSVQQVQQQQQPQLQPSLPSQPSPQQQVKRVHPKILWDMSDEEWNIFGDRFPIQFDKKKLLGRGGFSLVWLGEHRKTKEKFAIKQILSNNTHQSHLKEIWFGTHFFETGNVKQKYHSYPGNKNLVKFLAYDIKPLDTWIFYEICGESLGNHLYDLRGENNGTERVYRLYHRSLYQTFRRETTELKKLLKELALVLDLMQDQRIVHSDLKTENILIQTIGKGDQQIINQIKLIDYGSSFPFDDLKQFSMATPEYMCPEILNYILYENSMNYHQSLLKYLTKYKKPWVIDVWSLGCVILEIISGIPLWMSLKTIVNKKGKEKIEYGLFAVKGRLQIINFILKEFSRRLLRDKQRTQQLQWQQEEFILIIIGIKIDKDLKYLLKRMLSLDPDKRISPKEIIQFLEPEQNKILYTQ